MEDLKIHLSLLERLAFFILKSSRFIQDIFSKIFWKVFALVPLWAAHLLFGDNTLGYKRIVFHRKKIGQFIFGKIINIILKINRYLNGLSSESYDYYPRLLTWNPAIPLIALKSKNEEANKIYRLLWLGSEVRGHPGSNTIEGEVIVGTSDIAGIFKILSKETSENDNVVKIVCVWISGNRCGSKFTIKRFPGDDDLLPMVSPR